MKRTETAEGNSLCRFCVSNLIVAVQSYFDSRDYPEVAVREALLNMLVHRDYGFSASALISIYADRRVNDKEALY